MQEVEIDTGVYLDCYQHLVSENEIDIELIWGGRDSGKSRHVAMQLTEEAMALDYFRCILIKQTHESIKDAQWQMIKDVAEEWGVDHLFKFREHPLSISCVNRSTFATRGMDKASKIKSFTNPSHVWIEEGNQLSEESFITILTGLRSDHGRVKLFITFNPEANTPDYTDFWLYKTFFAKYEPRKSFTGEIVIPVKLPGGITKTVRLKYRSTHTTYHDNPYCTLQRIAMHESLSVSNPYWHKVFTEGEWGNEENDNPWAFAFSRQKHLGRPVLDRRQILYLSFDFNRNPACCTVIQWYDNKVKVLETIKLPKSGTDALCNYILLNYPGMLYMVTGDYSGQTASSIFEEQVTNYTVIKSKLRLADGALKLMPNPRLQKNQTHVNNILQYYDVEIHSENAKGLIFDMEKVKKRADGTILKENRDDPAQQADALDTFRYFCNTFMGWFQPPIPSPK